VLFAVSAVFFSGDFIIIFIYLSLFTTKVAQSQIMIIMQSTIVTAINNTSHYNYTALCPVFAHFDLMIIPV